MTKIIFRKFKKGGDLIAIFPALPGDSNYFKTCLSYQTKGQHGPCELAIINDTLPVKKADYQELLNELKLIGYNDIQIAARASHLDFNERRKAILK